MSADATDSGDKAAAQVLRILDGTKAESIPVAYPEGRLEINEGVADKLQIKFGPDILNKRGQIY